MVIESVNPATGERIQAYEEMKPEAVSGIVDRCHAAFLAWREVPFGERTRLMKAAAQVLRDRREGFARLMTDEMGKPVAGGRSEVDKCAWVCDFSADLA